MRLLEIAFLLALVLSAVSFFIAPARRSTILQYAPHIAMTTALIHVLVDHGRWSLYPAYAAAALMAIVGIGRLRDNPSPDRPWLRRAGGTLALLVVAASAALASALPVFRLPAPTGQYLIGTRTLELTDSTRAEDLTSNPDDVRTVVVRLWFPADSARGATIPYASRDAARAMSRGLQLPYFALDQLTLVETRSDQRSALSPAVRRWPLLLFSHGYGIGVETQNTAEMEDLASHGYVVASIAHPYEAAAVTLTDGRVLLSAPPSAMRDTAAQRRSLPVIQRLATTSDTGALRTLTTEIFATTPVLDTSLARWTADTRFVLDRLTAMSSGSARDTLFVNRLETGRVGVFGMSFGGATAADFCTRDPRCAAGANLDGLAYGGNARPPMPRPFLFATSADFKHMHDLYYYGATAPAWRIAVARTKHMDFTDYNFVSPLAARTGLLGGLPAERMHELLRATLLAFFDTHLRLAEAPTAAALRERFPELTLDQR